MYINATIQLQAGDTLTMSMEDAAAAVLAALGGSVENGDSCTVQANASSTVAPPPPPMPEMATVPLAGPTPAPQ